MRAALFCRGYYPKGGGEVIVRVSPVKQLAPVTLTERGSVTRISGRAFVAGALPFKVRRPFVKIIVVLYSFQKGRERVRGRETSTMRVIDLKQIFQMFLAVCDILML